MRNAFLRGGATSLAVALVEEGVTLREAEIVAPILLLSEPPPDAFEDVVANNLTPTLYRLEAVEALQRASAAPAPRCRRRDQSRHGNAPGGLRTNKTSLSCGKSDRRCAGVVVVGPVESSRCCRPSWRCLPTQLQLERFTNARAASASSGTVPADVARGELCRGHRHSGITL